MSEGRGIGSLTAKDADEALEESEARYRALSDQSPLGVFTFDRTLRLTDCNPAFVRLIGTAHEALVGQSMRTLSDARILPAVDRVLEGEPLYDEGPPVPGLG